MNIVNKISEPLVSVILPVYNSDKYLSESINSILNQTYKNFELIVVNDGSIDTSGNIILSFKDSRIIYLKNDSNRGIAFSTNRAFDIAKGKYIAGADSDDIYLENRLEVQLNFMEENSDIDISGAGYIAFGANEYQFSASYNNEQIRSYFLWGMLIANPCFMIKRSFLDKHNLRYNESIYASQDYEFYERIASSTQAKFSVIKNVLFKYRIHENNISTKCRSIAKATSFLVRERQLKKLLDADFKREFLLFLELTYSGAINNFSEVVSCLKLLFDIKKANSEKSIYPIKDFNANIKQKYFMIGKRAIFIARCHKFTTRQMMLLPLILMFYFLKIAVFRK